MQGTERLTETIANAARYTRTGELPPDGGGPLKPLFKAAGLNTPVSRGVAVTSVSLTALFLLEPEFMFKDGVLRPFKGFYPDDHEATWLHPGVVAPVTFLLVGAFT